MIQDMEFIGNRNLAVFQVVDRAYDVAIGHIPARIVIDTNDDDTEMTTVRRLDQNMQVPEIIVILRDKCLLVLHRVQQMTNVPRARKSRIARQHNLVTVSSQP